MSRGMTLAEKSRLPVTTWSTAAREITRSTMLREIGG